MKFIRCIITGLSLILIWQLLTWLFKLPIYILPSPMQVIDILFSQTHLLIQHTIPTVFETLLGLLLAIILGSSLALSMIFFRPLKFWMMPILILSQALPTFAIAPLFVIWFGYGIASKIMTTLLMLFFPIASAFFDGLRQTEKGWLDLSCVMSASRWLTLRYVRLPAALPSLASGIRVATAAAPIGAVIGEWVGSSEGLGYLMLNANARMQIDVMFAALFILMIFSLILYFTIDYLLRRFIFWR